MEHVNNGGNSAFISPVTAGVIEAEIRELKFTDQYYRMKSVADSDATDIYLYSKIAFRHFEYRLILCVANLFLVKKFHTL